MAAFWSCSCKLAQTKQRTFVQLGQTPRHGAWTGLVPTETTRETAVLSPSFWG